MLSSQQQTIEPPGKSTVTRNLVLLITTIASFLIPFMSSSTNVALPIISKEFSINAVNLAWVNNAYMLVAASLMVPFGRLADIYGRRPLFIFGTFVFTFGCVLAAVSISAPMLFFSRAVQGMGGASIFSTSVPILISAFPSQERGKVLGINTASVYLGLSLGPFLGGLLTRYVTWRGIFATCFILSLIIVAISLMKLRGEPAPGERKKFDLPGSAVYICSLVAVIYGVSLLPAITGVWFIIAGAACGIAFIWWESRAREPLVHLDLFRHNRGFSFSILAALVNYSGSWAVSFLLSLYLQYIKGLAPQVAGLVLMTNPAIQALLSPITGRLSDRLEPRLLASAGMGLTAFSIGLLAFINETTSIAYIITALALLGIGFALFSSPNTNAVMGSVEHKHYGIASAMLSTFRQMGMMFSMGIVMLVFALIIGRVEISPEYYPALVTSVRTVFLISALLCAGAITFSLARGNIYNNSKVKSQKSKP